MISLSESLASRGYDVSVATLGHPRRPEVTVERGVTVRSLHGTMQRSAGLFSDNERRHAPPFPDPELTMQLASIVKDTKPDIVHAHNWLLHSSLPLKRFSRAGLVVCLHDYGLVCARKTMMRNGAEICPGPSVRHCFPCAAKHYGAAVGSVTTAANWVSSLYERRVADRFIAVSNAVATSCGLPGGRAPYDVLPTFIPDEVGTLETAPDALVEALPPDGYSLFVGDLNRNKGAHVLLQAYAALTNAPPLVMIGRRCPDMPDDLPLNVHVFESWPHASIMRAWSKCLFGVAPSVWPEACGTIVMEAHAVGPSNDRQRHRRLVRSRGARRNRSARAGRRRCRSERGHVRTHRQRRASRAHGGGEPAARRDIYGEVHRSAHRTHLRRGCVAHRELFPRAFRGGVLTGESTAAST